MLLSAFWHCVSKTRVVSASQDRNVTVLFLKVSAHWYCLVVNLTVGLCLCFPSLDGKLWDSLTRRILQEFFTSPVPQLCRESVGRSKEGGNSLTLDHVFLKKSGAEVHGLCCPWHGSAHFCPVTWPWHCINSFMKDYDLGQQSPHAEKLNQFPEDDSWS